MAKKTKGKPDKKPKLLPKKSTEPELRTQVQNLGRSMLGASGYYIMRRMSHAQAALSNVGLYTWKKAQHETGHGATAAQIDAAMHTDVNFYCLQSNSVQAARRKLLESINSFFRSLDDWKEHPEKYKARPKFPKFHKHGTFCAFGIYQVPKIEKGKWKLPMSREFEKKYGKLYIPIPANLKNKKITYIEIVPKQGGRFFEAHYTYEIQVPRIEKAKTTVRTVLAGDLGVENLFTGATSEGDAFIIDGRILKSINQYFNKEISKLQAENMKNGISKRVLTKRMAGLWMKREHEIDGCFTHAIGELRKKVEEYGITDIVVGKNDGWKQCCDIGRKNNQQFVQIPFNNFISRIRDFCARDGIGFHIQEESYTSKASFLDNDPIPVYKEGVHHKGEFSGTRVHRGQYRSKNGRCINADVNGVLNTLRKSGLIEGFAPDSVKEPARIRI